MNDFFHRNLNRINLVIAACCLTVHEVTMYRLAYWTNWSDSSGAVGGILDYKFLGISTIYHVTAQGVRGQALYSFPDVNSYLLMALAILNFAVIVKQARALEAAPAIGTKRVAERNLVMALLCILGYVWATMMGIDRILNSGHGGPSIGGVVKYNYPLPLFYIIFSLYKGQTESMGIAGGPDYAAWLILTTIILNLLPILRALLEKAGFTG